MTHLSEADEPMKLRKRTRVVLEEVEYQKAEIHSENTAESKTSLLGVRGGKEDLE